jgi:hypothetical protein
MTEQYYFERRSEHPSRVNKRVSGRRNCMRFNDGSQGVASLSVRFSELNASNFPIWTWMPASHASKCSQSGPDCLMACIMLIPKLFSISMPLREPYRQRVLAYDSTILSSS